MATRCCCWGREAVARGYTVQFTTAMELLGALVKVQQQGTLEVRLAQYAKPELLINRCAEGGAYGGMGYLPLEPQAGHLFFQLISRRYRRGSVLISSNRPVQEWDEVYCFGEGFAYGDEVVAAAILNRLMHHSHVVKICGDSYRLREKRRAGLRRNSPTGINDGRKPTQPATETMSKKRYRQHSQGGTTPTTKPQTSRGVTQFSVSKRQPDCRRTGCADPSGCPAHAATFFQILQEQGADFLLTVIDAVFSIGAANQKTLHRQIRSQFQGKRRIPFLATDHEVSHGRDITWTLRVKQAPEHIRSAWIGTSWIVEVVTEGTRDGQPFRATLLFLTSLRSTPKALLRLVRNRWSIENSWHWARDTQLKEDAHRYRGNGAGAMASLRTAALNLLRLDGVQSIRSGLQAVSHDITALLAMERRQPEVKTC